MHRRLLKEGQGTEDIEAIRAPQFGKVVTNLNEIVGAATRTIGLQKLFLAKLNPARVVKRRAQKRQPPAHPSLIHVDYFRERSRNEQVSSINKTRTKPTLS
jgi:hypothetical protein